MTSPPSDRPWLAPFVPDLVWFEGPDTIRFLNDLISREIADIADGETRRSLLLGPQGKLAFILWVLRSGERIGLLTDPGRGEELAAALTRYRIRVDVEVVVETGPRWLVMGEWDGFDVSWPGVTRRLVVGERPGLEEGSVEEYRRLRIEAGEPEWGVDVDEATIPHESGLVAASVDFDKGCYLGQELVARIQSRGANTPRRLRRVVAGEPLTSGAAIVADGKDVGTLTSAAANSGLALVHRSVEAGVTVDVGGVPAVVEEVSSGR